MATFIIPTTIVGAAFLVLIFFFVRNTLVPRRVEGIEKLLQQKKTNQAIRAVKQLLNRDQRHVDAHFLLGKAYLSEGKSELALMEFKLINRIGLFGKICTERVFRKLSGELYARFDHPDEALKEYLLLAKLEPNDADHYHAIGDLFERKGNADKAMAYYRKTLQLNERHMKAQHGIGRLYYKAKKLSEARDALMKALKTDPEEYQSHFTLGRVFKELGDSSSALRCFEKAQKMPSLKIKSLVERGGCYLKLQRYDQAEAEMKRAINLSEDDAAPEILYARYFLAICYEKTRQLDKALEQWEKIHAKRRSFRDVAAKLEQYQDLRQDDNMKDYLTVGDEGFRRLCVSATEALNLAARDVTPMPNGCQIVALETESKWRHVRQKPRLCWFFRLNESIGDSTVRQLLEQMKRQNISLGIIATSSTFSQRALEFAESRPIHLLGKEKLQQLLKTGHG
jgi:tetratricopeptide (TPR) repeat protein